MPRRLRGSNDARRTLRDAGLVAVAVAFAPGAARADDPSSGPAEAALVRPPPTERSFVQYGVAFTVEGVASAGPVCSAPNAPCILGSGGGVAVRVGYRPGEQLYFGGAYEFSKQDPNNLYRLGILQQARAELRRYFPTGSRTTPFVLFGAGVAGYGDEWDVDTVGVTAAVGIGLELELSGAVHLGVAIAYRPLYLTAWNDSSNTPRAAGVAHLIGLELALEAQDRVGARLGAPR